MSLKKKIKKSTKKMIKGGKKVVGTAAAVALLPVAIPIIVKKAKDD